MWLSFNCMLLQNLTYCFIKKSSQLISLTKSLSLQLVKKFFNSNFNRIRDWNLIKCQWKKSNIWQIHVIFFSFSKKSKTDVTRSKWKFWNKNDKKIDYFYFFVIEIFIVLDSSVDIMLLIWNYFLKIIHRHNWNYSAFSIF